MDEIGIGTLDYVYAPSSYVAEDARWFVSVMGAELAFAVEAVGTRVAMFRVGSDVPPILLTDHLPDDRPVFVYSVEDFEAASRALTARGWKPDRSLDLPMGPATTFQAPGGLRLAIYELQRPFVVESMVGRRDF